MKKPRILQNARAANTATQRPQILRLLLQRWFGDQPDIVNLQSQRGIIRFLLTPLLLFQSGKARSVFRWSQSDMDRCD